ncbi:MAG: outer membrane protein assembly factor BamE [Alphaproteobacteria bacterium]|nr:outer membrane protein assembly factor BamE [Alphaproteobacteria bacterium]
MNRNTLRLCGILGALLIAWSVTACASRISTRGNVPDADALSEIRLGVQTREDIAELIGNPSTVTTFGDYTWYYISETVEMSALGDLEVLDRKIIAIDFDTRGLVQNVRQYDLRSGRVVKMVERKTPTPGKEPSANESILGGIGTLSE